MDSFFITVVFLRQCWQARSNGLHVDQRTIEKTVSRTYIKRPRYNGYESVFTNLWLLRQKNRCSIKGSGKYQQREWTHSLFAVPIVRSHLPVFALTPRRECVYTRHPQQQRAMRGVLTSHPTKLAKIGMRVKTLSDRRHKKCLRV